MVKKKDRVMYRLTITDTQLQIIKMALEEYFRVGMNQWIDIADRLAMKNVDLSPENPNHREIFDEMINRRDTVKEKFEEIGRILWPCWNCRRDDDENIACDIWQVIKHQQWLDDEKRWEWSVDGNKPLIVSSEPLAKCEKISD